MQAPSPRKGCRHRRVAAGVAGREAASVTHTHPQGSGWTPGGSAGCAGDPGTAWQWDVGANLGEIWSKICINNNISPFTQISVLAIQYNKHIVFVQYEIKCSIQPEITTRNIVSHNAMHFPFPV